MVPLLIKRDVCRNFPGRCSLTIAISALIYPATNTREEVVDAILMTLTVSGIRGVVHCLPEAVRQYEK
jgi:hypothetical protein